MCEAAGYNRFCGLDAGHKGPHSCSPRNEEHIANSMIAWAADAELALRGGHLLKLRSEYESHRHVHQALLSLGNLHVSHMAYFSFNTPIWSMRPKSNAAIDMGNWL